MYRILFLLTGGKFCGRLYDRKHYKRNSALFSTEAKIHVKAILVYAFCQVKLRSMSLFKKYLGQETTPFSPLFAPTLLSCFFFFFQYMFLPLLSRVDLNSNGLILFHN